MVVFHFCFDLENSRLLTADFYSDPFWLNLRTVIVTLFLDLVGVSYSIHQKNSFNIRKFITRQRNLLIGLLLVSASTYFISGERYIFFGILHFIFVAALLNLIFGKFYYLNLVLGMAIIIVGKIYTNIYFHSTWLKWIGFQLTKLATDGYAPIFPCYGVVLISIFFGKWIFVKNNLTRSIDCELSQLPFSPPLAFFGRHDLFIYMFHQPILIGLITVYLKIT